MTQLVSGRARGPTRNLLGSLKSLGNAWCATEKQEGFTLSVLHLGIPPSQPHGASAWWPRVLQGLGAESQVLRQQLAAVDPEPRARGSELTPAWCSHSWL